MDYQAFIEEQTAAIRTAVGSGLAINALSGGVDSSVVTVLGHRALGDRLRTVFIDNALMRQDEPQRVARWFADMGIPVEVLDARREFLAALAGLTDPEDKRNAITHTFYSKVFGELVRTSGATFLLHGTILTDIEETVAGIKRQHNILAQIGIDPQHEYGYRVLEPLETLRKDGVREVARLLGLPPQIAGRIPFPGPALATRIVGEATEARLATVPRGDGDRRRGIGRHGRVPIHGRPAGRQGDGHSRRQARVRPNHRRPLHRQRGRPHRHGRGTALGQAASNLRRITEIPGVNRCLYDLTPKPPATIEYV